MFKISVNQKLILRHLANADLVIVASTKHLNTKDITSDISGRWHDQYVFDIYFPVQIPNEFHVQLYIFILLSIVLQPEY